MLRESAGNMYGFVTHTWNPIKGLCPHGCEYCYMHRFPQKPPRLDEKEMKTDLGEGNFIFVGSSIDMFAPDIPVEWIARALDYIGLFPRNRYLFQTKNPQRMAGRSYPYNSIFCTTIETNRTYRQMGKTPSPWERAMRMAYFPKEATRMVTIEPIIDFDVHELTNLMKMIEPVQVNIGADSKGHNLPEPPWYKVERLIERISSFTRVYQKDNLKRLRHA